jgi:ribonuclease HI
MALIHIYTDGAARGNPGKGGCGVVMLSGSHRKELALAFRFTTNNRMELLAVIVALESLKSGDHQITIYSDSKYVVDAFLKRWIDGWVRKNWDKVKNPDLWQRLLPLYKKLKPQFVWVKGHASNPMNNRCDELATEAADQGPWLIDTAYEALSR